MKKQQFENEILIGAENIFTSTTCIGERSEKVTFFSASMPHVFDYFLSTSEKEVKNWFKEVVINRVKLELDNLNTAPEFALTHWFSKQKDPDRFNDTLFSQKINCRQLRAFSTGNPTEDLVSLSPFEMYADLGYETFPLNFEFDFKVFMNNMEKHIDTKVTSERYMTSVFNHINIAKELERDIQTEYRNLLFSFCACIGIETATYIKKNT